MLTPAIIDLVGCIFETFPYLLFFIYGDRTDIFPFFMVFLEFFECPQNRCIKEEFFGLLTECDLCFQVFLKVEVLKFFIQLDLIKEPFYQEMIILPEVVYFSP